MTNRSRTEHIRYMKHLESESSDCPFCAIKPGDDQFISETRSFKIIKNLFGYSLWDNQDVKHHLMVVPKKHTDTLADISDGAALEFVKIISEYESQGYSIYARPAGSNMKTIAHQHTHLIKTEGHIKRLILVSTRPYIRFVC